MEPGLATELVVDKAKYQALPEDLQAIVRDVCQAEYDQVSSDFVANDPRALKTLVEDHGVQVRQFPQEVLEAGAVAAQEIILGLRDSEDAMTRKVTEHFIESLNLMRSRTEGNDMNFVQARQAYFSL